MSILSSLYKEPVQREADCHSTASFEYLSRLVRVGSFLQLPEGDAFLDHPQFRDRGWIDHLVDDILRMCSRWQEWNYRRILKSYQLDDPDVIRRLNLADDMILILTLLQETHALSSTFLHTFVHLADLEHPHQVLGFNLSVLSDPEDKQCYSVTVEKYRTAHGTAQETCRTLIRELQVLRNTLYGLIFGDSDKEMQTVLTGINLDFGLKSSHAKTTWLRRELSIVREPYPDALHFQALSLYSKYMGQLYADLQQLPPTFAEYNEIIAQLKTKGSST